MFSFYHHSAFVFKISLFERKVTLCTCHDVLFSLIHKVSMLYVFPCDFKVFARYCVNNSVKLLVQYNMTETTHFPSYHVEWTVDVTIHQQHSPSSFVFFRFVMCSSFVYDIFCNLTTTISFPLTELCKVLACMMLLLFVVVFQFHFKIKFCRHSQ